MSYRSEFEDYKDGFLAGYDEEQFDSRDKPHIWIKGYADGRETLLQDRKDLDRGGSSNT